MAILSKTTWARHANPWSGWTRVLSIPLLMLGFYLESLWILALAIGWIIVNPILFPPSKRTTSWMSRGVLGEQYYYLEGRIKRDLPTLLSLLNVPVFFAFLYFGWQQEFVLMVIFGVLSMALKFWFLECMVTYYDKLPRDVRAVEI